MTRPSLTLPGRVLLIKDSAQKHRDAVSEFNTLGSNLQFEKAEAVRQKCHDTLDAFLDQIITAHHAASTD